MLNNLLQMLLKQFQKEQIKKIAEATGYLMVIKIADEVTKVSRTSPQNNLETKNIR